MSVVGRMEMQHWLVQSPSESEVLPLFQIVQRVLHANHSVFEPSLIISMVLESLHGYERVEIHL